MTGLKTYVEMDAFGRPVEISFDHNTIWVNEPGHCIARFSMKLGAIDVHGRFGSGLHCLDCRKGDLEDFITSVKKHHHIDIRPFLRSLP